MSTIAFWFDPASTYSYLAAMRVDAVAASAGAEVEWRPFLLGPIFKGQGMATSPFNLFPARGRYMWRDMERLCADLAIPFRIPDAGVVKGFPRNSLLAARAAVVALRQPWGRDFVRSVYVAEFGDWRDIAEPAVIGELVARAGGDADAVLAAAASDPVKLELRASTDEAARLGIFGAPTFSVGGELFWGNDRLEQALAHAPEGRGVTYLPVMDGTELDAYVREVFPQSGDRWRVESLGPGELSVAMTVSERALRPGGTISGPTMFFLADITAYVLILAHIGRVELAVTTSLNINFLSKPPLADLRARGRLIKLGRRLAICEVHIRSVLDDDTMVAQATATYSIPPRP